MGKVTVVLPAYNEEEMLEDCVSQCRRLRSPEISDVEILVCENGSSDNTLQVARRCADDYPEVRVLHLDQASYGDALRMGLEHASHEISVIFNVDFFDLEFVRKALLEIQDGADVVIGSKGYRPGLDRRPWVRRIITRSFNSFLRFAFDFQGTDTHGLKTFRTARIREVIRDCETRGEIFDTELILRSQRSGLRISETPVSVSETRPSRYSLAGRIPRTLRDLAQLWWVLHFPERTRERAKGRGYPDPI
jgi:glycosyltransferase involved in cell wall biosynthesis